MKKILILLMLLLLLGCQANIPVSEHIGEEKQPEICQKSESQRANYELHYIKVRLDIPETWDYLISGDGVSTPEFHAEPADIVGIHFWPKEAPEAVFMLNFYQNGLALCGTGAEFEPFELANGLHGTKRSEVFSGGSLSQYLMFQELPGCYALETLIDQSLMEKYGPELMSILETAVLAEGVLSEAEAIAIAQKECTVEYDTVRGDYDHVDGQWRVAFYMQNTLGNDQTVTIGPDGSVLGSEYGE